MTVEEFLKLIEGVPDDAEITRCVQSGGDVVDIERVTYDKEKNIVTVD